MREAWLKSRTAARLGRVLLALSLAGCARFHPEPLSPAQTAAQFENRSLSDPGLKTFVETNLHKTLEPWPLESWDVELLTLAAFYYQPDLEVARLQWATALGGERTAGGRPNPVLNVTPGYNFTTLTPSPWIPLGSLDVTVETAGKRGYRKAQAAHLSEAARCNLATVAWRVRSELRSGLLDFLAAEHRQALLRSQVVLQERSGKLLDEQVQVGALSSADAASFRIALQKARLELADAQRQRVEARGRVAEAIGVPVRALDGLKLNSDLGENPVVAADLTTAEARRVALLSRADILGALAEYAAAQSALQLEIAKQYPDVHLQPGYEFDQGDSKWSLGLTVELPILNQNQGPIAEATARRQETAARFNALQARVVAEVDRAVEVFRATTESSSTFRSLAGEQARRRDSVAAQVKAGAAEPLELLNAQLEFTAAELVQLDGQVRLQQAFGALEAALQRPVESWPAVAQAVSDQPKQAKP